MALRCFFAASGGRFLFSSALPPASPSCCFMRCRADPARMIAGRQRHLADNNFPSATKLASISS